MTLKPLRTVVALGVLTILTVSFAQGLNRLVDGLNRSYAQEVECTTAMANRGYVYCAEYRYEMDVMLLDVPFSIADAGFTGLIFERNSVDIAIDGVDHHVSFLPGFLLVRRATEDTRTMYVVDVKVESTDPASGPVTLLVLESPDSSRWEPGTSLGTVPGRVVLDQEGMWTLQGELNGRVTESVTMSVPENREITLRFP